MDGGRGVIQHSESHQLPRPRAVSFFRKQRGQFFPKSACTALGERLFSKTEIHGFLSANKPDLRSDLALRAPLTMLKNSGESPAAPLCPAGNALRRDPASHAIESPDGMAFDSKEGLSWSFWLAGPSVKACMARLL